MKTNRILLIVILIAIGSIVAYMMNVSQKKQAFTDEIVAYWEWNNNFLKTSNSSPVKDKEHFTDIEYFEPQLDYRVTAKVELIKGNEIIELQTSDKQIRRYLKYAKLHFSLLDKAQQLTLFQNVSDKSDYFLPFFDLTNGVTTYGAGRYLNVKVKSIKSIELDFNKAISPYCAYNEDYSCPIPPKENFLRMQVLAGQKYIVKN